MTPGQVAFETFWQSLEMEFTWERQGPEQKAAWESAALASARYLYPLQNEGCD